MGWLWFWHKIGYYLYRRRRIQMPASVNPGDLLLLVAEVPEGAEITTPDGWKKVGEGHEP